jgi:hypothetical protein
MVPFDYRGRDWRAKNRVRKFLVELFLLICGILLFPFVLLNFLFWALGRLGSVIAGWSQMRPAGGAGMQAPT